MLAPVPTSVPPRSRLLADEEIVLGSFRVALGRRPKPASFDSETGYPTALADEISGAAGRVRGDLMRRGMAGAGIL